MSNPQYDANLQVAQDPNVSKYLNMIGAAEGATYDTGFGGTKIADLSAHPNTSSQFTQTDGKVNSTTAAGKYQFLNSTWNDVASKIGAPDFGPQSQDAAAVELLRRSGSLADVQAGNFQAALQKDNKTWASLPGSPYAQHTRSQAFVQQQLGDAPAVAPPRAPAPSQSDPNWPSLALPPLRPETSPTLANAAVDSFDQGQPNMSPAAGVAQSGARFAADSASQAVKDNTGFGDVFSTSRQDPRDQTMFNILDAINAPPKEVPPTPTWVADNHDKIMAPCGTDDDCYSYMANHVTGPQSMAEAHGQVAYRNSLDQTYQAAGPWANFLGHLAGGSMDPVALAAGVGVGKGLELAGMGSAALIKSGQAGKAFASLAAEGAGANVSITGIQQALGETKTPEDYAMAAAQGMLLTTITGGRGAIREANSNHLAIEARTMRQQAARDQIAKLQEYQQRTGETDPIKVAQGVMDEQNANIREAMGEATTVKPAPDSARAIPKEVEEAQRASHEGKAMEPIEPTVQRETPEIAQPDGTTVKGETPLPEPLELPKIDENMLGDAEVPTQLQNEDGTKATLHYSRDDDGESYPLPNGKDAKIGPGDGTNGRRNFAVGEVLDAMGGAEGQAALARSGRWDLTPLVKYMRENLSDAVKNVRVVFESGRSSGGMHRVHSLIESASNLGNDARLTEHIAALHPLHQEMVLHEMIHAATQSKIDAYLNGGKLSRGDKMTMDQFSDLFERYKARVAELHGEEHIGNPKPLLESINHMKKAGADDLTLDPMRTEYYAKYGTKNLHEFATTAMTSNEVRTVLRGMPGNDFARVGASTGWESFVRGIKKLMGFRGLDAGEGTAAHDATALVDRIIHMDGTGIRYKNGGEALHFEADESPALGANAGKQSASAQIYGHAQSWLAANPINSLKLKVLTQKISKWGGMSDGLVLASSKHPVLQMVSGIVTETTTGAAGRGNTAAIKMSMLHRKFVGDSVLRYQDAYTRWGKTNGVTVWDNVVNGTKRREFDRAVYNEVLDRKYNTPGRAGLQHPDVAEAADHLEGLFERAREAQVQAGTLGSANLPGNSRGYMPQALDGHKLQTLTPVELQGLHDELSNQFQSNLGWDKNFSDMFAPYYTDRVRRRAQGSKEVDGLAAGGDALQVVRDTLDDMAADPTLRDKLTSANKTSAGLGQTKSRLDIDLRRPFAPGKTLLDVYADNPLNLARAYAKRTAGNVALTERGILGVKGIRELRESAMDPRNGPPATLNELDAYDRVMAEMTGTPVAGQVVSAGATNLAMLTNLQRMGGNVITQASDMFGLMHHLGLQSLLNGVGSLPRMRGEIGRLRKGLPSGNHILTSIEHYGGELGTEHYKMVAPLDPPDGRVEDYMKQAGLLTRLLRMGGHVQSKISFMDGLMAMQHRMVAEQITMRAARFIRDGGDNLALADMGFTPKVVANMKGDLHNVAQWDGNGNLTSFDLSKVTDPETAEAYVQAVHRGTSQIIQGTFTGERAKWMHNDYAKLLLQLRTFGLVGTEKQFGRTVLMRGGGPQAYAYAGGVMLAQMALALPIHFARVQLASAGRSDRQKFLDDNLSPAALVKSTMNYSSMSGSLGDIVELLSSVAGGWTDSDTSQALGNPRGATAKGVGSLVPAAGTVDNALKVFSGKSDIHTAIKQLPFSNIPYLAPALNQTK